MYQSNRYLFSVQDWDSFILRLSPLPYLHYLTEITVHIYIKLANRRNMGD